MKPLIKWPGGKTRELNWIKSVLPPNFSSDTTYIEPFFGGGAVFFDLLPKKGFLNDLDFELVNFYKLIKEQNHEFFDYLLELQKDWRSISILVKQIYQLYLKSINSLRSLTPKGKKETSKESGEKIISQLDISTFRVKHPENLRKFFKKEIIRKLRHTLKMEKKTGVIYDNTNHFLALETALKAGYYYYIRELYNKVRTQTVSNNSPTHFANFYFVREFCFGSMFRFNSKNEYNIPYGGMDYNKKDFLKKIKLLQHQGTIDALNQVTLYNLDFTKFFKKILPAISNDSFVFLDPPYDSDFSDYSGNFFSSEDHIRLSRQIKELTDRKIPTMLIIAETPLIQELYGNGEFNIIQFDKKYTYNVRGRNNRKSSHVIITNY